MEEDIVVEIQATAISNYVNLTYCSIYSFKLTYRSNSVGRDAVEGISSFRISLKKLYIWAKEKKKRRKKSPFNL